MKLSLNQSRFCENYAKSGNATQSYIDAGYKVTTENSAAASAYTLLRNPKIDAYIQELKALAANRSQITTDKLIRAAAEIAFADFGDVIEIDEHGMPSIKKNANINQLDGISASESISKDGRSRGFSVKRSDRLKALDMLAKMTGAYDRDEKDDGRNLADSASRILDALRNLRKK